MSERASDRARLDLEALSETGRVLSQSIDLDFILNNLLLILMSKLLVSRAAFLLYDPVERTYKVAATKGARFLKKGQKLAFPPLTEPGPPPPPLTEYGYQLAIPVQVPNRHIGVLVLGPRHTGAPYTEEDQSFVLTLVNMASVAIYNALLVEELRQANRELDARLQALNTLFELSQEFNRTMDRERLIKLLAYALMGQLLVRQFAFLLRRPAEQGPCDGDRLEVVAARGLEDLQLSPELMAALCRTEDLVVLDYVEDAPLRTLRDRGLKLVLPLQLQGKTQGLLLLGPKMTGEPYEVEDVEFLYALGTLALIAIENTYLIEARIAQERLEEEIRLARSIQERLLPQRLPQLPGLELAARAIPSREVAGDYYDALLLPEGVLVLAIADVTGKGVPAALLMASLQASLRAILRCHREIPEATRELNRLMYENTDPGHFVTFFWGQYAPSDHRLTYVNAGHNPPLLLRREGSVDWLREGGLLLGVLPDTTYRAGRLDLQVGDVLVLYTDGVTEAMNGRGEFYGEDRLVACVLKHREAPASTILEAILRDVQTFTEGLPPGDDLTLLVVRRQA